MFMRDLVLVGLAGGLGAVSRYAVGLAAARALGERFAFGTLLVNVVGCLLLGALLEVDRHTGTVGHPGRLLVAVGFLGAFTTFSTFGYETFRYAADGAYQLALLNVTANVILGLVAVWGGWLLARRWVGA